MEKFAVIEKKGKDVMLNEEIYRHGKWEKCYGRLADTVNEDLKDYVFLVKLPPSPEASVTVEEYIKKCNLHWQFDEDIKFASFEEKALIDFLKNLPSVKNDWIKVQDSLPTKSDNYLTIVDRSIYVGRTGKVTTFLSTEIHFANANEPFMNGADGVITHWQPLPEKPKI